MNKNTKFIILILVLLALLAWRSQTVKDVFKLLQKPGVNVADKKSFMQFLLQTGRNLAPATYAAINSDAKLETDAETYAAYSAWMQSTAQW